MTVSYTHLDVYKRQQYYNLIENGERQKDLDLSIATKLSEIFEVSIDWIAEQEQKLKNEGE